jgi:hypothetical protein
VEYLGNGLVIARCHGDHYSTVPLELRAELWKHAGAIA